MKLDNSNTALIFALVLFFSIIDDKILTKKITSRIKESISSLNNHETDKSIQQNNNFQEYWGDLFVKKRSEYFWDHTSKLCKKENNKKKNNDDNILDGDNFRLPHKKPNDYAKLGFGDSAYFFDYLDPLLLSPIVNEFKRIFEEAKKFDRFKENYKDPYHITMMMSGKYDIKVNEKEKIKELKRIFPKLDENDLTNNITPTQLKQIFKTWFWGDKEFNLLLNKYKDTKDLIIDLFDKYDFDGSGRLSANEFLTLSVLENVHYSFLKPLNLTQTLNDTSNNDELNPIKVIKEVDFKQNSESKQSNCINCYKELVEGVIKIIFTYIDCQGKMSIQSEDLWDKLKFLKRSQNTDNQSKAMSTENSEENEERRWSMYECGEFRTSAPNDFVLKTSKQKKSYLNFEEFSRGILIGIINRQSDKLSIVDNDTISDKYLRWSKDGYTDKFCELVKTQKSK